MFEGSKFRCLLATLFGLATLLTSPLPASADDIETGHDNRTDGVSSSYEVANRYASLLTGAATYEISIETLPGPAGFTPALALHYSSDLGNGWLGIGWEIAGLDRIERSARFGVPAYTDPLPDGEYLSGDPYDRFDLYLSGMHYELFFDVFSRPAKYVSNPEAQLAIEHDAGPDGITAWRITDRSGVVYEFEGIAATGRPGYRFYPIRHAVDPNGNTITYEYTLDPGDGAYYPREVVYGPPQAPIQIEFELEPRTAPGWQAVEEVSDYRGGSRFVLNQRIAAITVRSMLPHGEGVWSPEPPPEPCPQINPYRIRRYELEYATTDRGRRSLLSEVRLMGLPGDAQRYTFSYQGLDSAGVGFEELVNQAPGTETSPGLPDLWPLKSARGAKSERGQYYPGVRWTDINGDALADMVWGLRNLDQQWTGADHVGGKAIAGGPLTWAPIASATRLYPKPLDPNVQSDYDDQGFPAPVARWYEGDTGSRVYQPAFAGTELVDVNNDGFVDIVHAFDETSAGGAVTRLTWLNRDGKAWELDRAWSLPEVLSVYKGNGQSALNGVKIVDVNGDGFPDLVSAAKGTFLNRGAGGGTGWATVPDPLWRTPVPAFGEWVGDRYMDYGVRYVDLNGDGLNDLLIYWNPLSEEPGAAKCKDPVRRAWINTGHAQANGSAYAEDDRWRVPVNIYNLAMFQIGDNLIGSHLGTQLVDINLDGLPDLLFSLTNSQGLRTRAVVFNTGSGWAPTATPNPLAYSSTNPDPNAWIDKLPDFAVGLISAAGTDVYEDNGVSLADFDGDGALDIGWARYYYAGSTYDEFIFTQRQVGIWLNRFKRPLLTRVDTPYGGAVAFEYRTSHSNGAHANHQDGQGVSRMPVPKPVVWSLTVDDGARSQVRTEFGYAGGLYDPARREFRGFRTVKVLPGGKEPGAPAAQRTYTFYQDDARKGRLSSVRVGDGKVFYETFYTYRSQVVATSRRGPAYDTRLQDSYTLEYDSVDAEHDLLYDLNFDVPDPDLHLRPCGALSYNPWRGAQPLANATCIGGLVDLDLEFEPATSGYNPKEFADLPLGGRAFNGVLTKSLLNYTFPAISVQAWVAPDPPGQEGSLTIVSHSGAFDFYLNRNNLLVAEAGGQVIKSPEAIPADSFTHVAFTYDGAAAARLYINGRLVKEALNLTGPIKSGTTLQIGGGLTSSLDEAKVFRAVVNTPRIVRTSYSYDSYGNLTDAVSYGDLADAQDDLVTHTDYDYRLEQHMLDRPRYTYVRQPGPFDEHKIQAATWYGYDERGNLLAQTGWAGERVADGHPLETAAGNPRTLYGYDPSGNLTSIQDPTGAVTTLTYHPFYAAAPIEVRDALGHVTRFEYYGVSLVEPAPDGCLGLFGQLKRVVEPNSNTTRYVYDRYGRLRAVYRHGDGDPAGGSLYPSVLYSYVQSGLKSAGGRDLLAVDTWLRTRSLDSDQPLSAAFTCHSQAAAAVTCPAAFDANYLAAGNWAQAGPGKPGAGGPAFLQRSIAYLDGFGRPLETISSAEGPELARIGSAVRCDPLGRPLEAFKPYLATDKPLYEPDSSSPAALYEQPAANGPKVSLVYDELGRPIKAVAPDGATGTFDYDRGTVTAIDAGGHLKVYRHDVYGRLVRVDEYALEFGPQGHQPASPHAAVDDSDLWQGSLYLDPKFPGTTPAPAPALPVVTTSLALLPVASTAYGYDLLGNLVTIGSGRQRIELDYNPLGQLIRSRLPDMGGSLGKAWTYAYDPAGRLERVTDPRGQQVGYEYDALGRPITKRAGASGDLQPVARWRYDDTASGGPYALGHLVAISDTVGTTDYQYDQVGRVITETWHSGPQAYSTAYDYDALDRLASVTYPSGEIVDYRYGQDGRVRTLGIRGGPEIVRRAQYGAEGDLRLLEYGNGVQTRYEYDDGPDGSQWLTGIVVDHAGVAPDSPLIPAVATVPLLRINYMYDNEANVTQERDLLAPQASARYEYDFLDRLSEAQRNNVVQPYLYDTLGNPKAIGGEPAVYGPDGNAGPHALVQIGSGHGATTFRHDTSGNLKRLERAGGDSWTYVYDAENRLASASPGGEGDDLAFAYDAYGSRVQKREGRAVTFYPSPFFEVRDGKVTTYYLLDGQAVARRDAEAGSPADLRFYHVDLLGSVRMVTGKDGAVAGKAEYGPFGETLAESGPEALGRYRFAGKELDASGLYYFGARYYDPALGRFLSPDPLQVYAPGLAQGGSQELNPYAYVLNNPTSYVDPRGLQGGPAVEFGKSPSDFSDPIYDEESGTWGEWIRLSDDWGQVISRSDPTEPRSEPAAPSGAGQERGWGDWRYWLGNYSSYVLVDMYHPAKYAVGHLDRRVRSTLGPPTEPIGSARLKRALVFQAQATQGRLLFAKLQAGSAWTNVLTIGSTLYYYHRAQVYHNRARVASGLTPEEAADQRAAGAEQFIGRLATTSYWDPIGFGAAFEWLTGFRSREYILRDMVVRAFWLKWATSHHPEEVRSYPTIGPNPRR